MTLAFELVRVGTICGKRSGSAGGVKVEVREVLTFFEDCIRYPTSKRRRDMKVYQMPRRWKVEV
jgi:hypothetical protein